MDGVYHALCMAVMLRLVCGWDVLTVLRFSSFRECFETQLHYNFCICGFLLIWSATLDRCLGVLLQLNWIITTMLLSKAWHVTFDCLYSLRLLSCSAWRQWRIWRLSYARCSCRAGRKSRERRAVNVNNNSISWSTVLVHPSSHHWSII